MKPGDSFLSVPALVLTFVSPGIPGVPKEAANIPPRNRQSHSTGREIGLNPEEVDLIGVAYQELVSRPVEGFYRSTVRDSRGCDRGIRILGVAG